VQFRKSKTFGGLRIIASKRGIGVSVGKGPLPVGIGADGKVRRTVRVPGTGVYDTKVIRSSGPPRAFRPTARAAHVLDVDSSMAYASGLRSHPVTETVRDTWAWLRADGRLAPLANDVPQVGIDPARSSASSTRSVRKPLGRTGRGGPVRTLPQGLPGCGARLRSDVVPLGVTGVHTSSEAGRNRRGRGP
jgi:hypothetical protein